MTTVSSMWEKKDTYTSKASEISRTLCLSGLAVVWVFRTPTLTGSSIAPALLWVSGLIILSLLSDLLQYVVGAARTAKIAREKELELNLSGLPPDSVVHYPENHPRLMTLLWRIKIALLIIAWLILLGHVGNAAMHASLPAIPR